jgi:hypothetical protein
MALKCCRGSGGTWTFEKWDKDKDTVDGKDVEFSGTWTFTPHPDPETHEATHKFVSGTEGRELPEEVTELIPEPKTGLTDGDVVTPATPSKTKVKVDGGTWTFKKWDKDKETVDGEDVEFTGTWIFTPNSDTQTTDTKTPDAKTPAANKKSVKTPKTGDQSPIELYLALMAVSSVCIAQLQKKRRKG